MILSNTAKVLDKLEAPESILNIPFWINIVETLKIEIQRKKLYHANKAANVQPKERVGDEMPSKEEANQYKLYQYHIETANLFFAIEKAISILMIECQELYNDYSKLQHNSYLRINKKLQQLIIDHDKLYKTAIFWEQAFWDEFKMHQNMTDVAYQLTKQLKACKTPSHDSKN